MKGETQWRNGCYYPVQTPWERRNNTLRWLENSGPLYEEITVQFRGPLPHDYYRVDSAFIIVAQENHEFTLFPENMSFASWWMASQASRGDVLTLKIRRV